MAKRNYVDPVLTKPLPSTRVPTLVIFVLIACIWLGYKYFFGPPQQLLGGPPPANTYVHYLQKPKPALKRVAPRPVLGPHKPVTATPAPGAQPAAMDDHATSR